MISKILSYVISPGQWSAVILLKEKHKQEITAKSCWFILLLRFQLEQPRNVQIL